MTSPVFIFGIARSGTNLLARLLDRHPAVAVALDPFLPWFKSLRNRIVASSGDARITADFDPLSAFEDYYFLSRGPATLDLITGSSAELRFAAGEEDALRAAVAARAALESPALAERLMRATGSDYRSYLDSALRIIGNSKAGGGCLWQGAKEVWAIDFLPLLARTYPKARFFVIERDPRAIVASLLAMAQRDATQGAHVVSYARHWRKFAAQARVYARDPAFGDRVQLVSYESLVRDAFTEAHRICAHLRLEFAPEMLDVSSEGWAGNSSFGGNQDIYAGSLEQWQKTLSREVQDVVEFHCGPEMALTEYRTATAWKRGPIAALMRSVREAAARPASWRSDSGQVAYDFGGELLRHALVESDEEFDARTLRETFLFPEILEAIRARHQSERA